MKIKADSEKMKLIGDNIIDASVEFEIKAKELESEIDKILDAWQGVDAERYISLLKDNYVVNLASLAHTIKDYGEYIQKVSNIYTLLEQGTIDYYNGGHY